jgi:ABC-type glycerol-3-phosphate transport system substrate-binding protein
MIHCRYIFNNEVRKMSKARRIPALILVLAVFVALFTGCNGSSESESTTPAIQTTPATTPAPTEATTTVPEPRTFGGRAFTISSAWIDGMWRAFPDQSELGAEKQAIYDKLEDDLDIRIEFILAPDGSEGIIPQLFAGDIPADVCDWKIHGWMPLAVQGLILPYDDPRIVEGGLDVNDPAAFFQPFTQAQNWNGKVYGAMWNGSHFLCEFGWCIYFNKQLISDAGVDDLYQVVREGKWDWNYFRDLAIKATKDYDGDGQIDIYGVGTFGYGSELFTNPGAEIIRDDNGKMKVVLDEPAALEALEFTRQFAFIDNVRHPEGYGDVHRRFTEGKVAMVWGEQWNTRSSSQGFKTTEVDYGLVPMPKAPGADYYVNVLGGVHSVSIYSGNTDQDIKDIAYILYEMGKRFTNDDWQVTYLENDLRGDEDALDMVLNYIWPHTVTDYAWSSTTVLDNFRNNIYLPMTEGLGTPVQLVEQYKDELQAEVDALFKQ